MSMFRIPPNRDYSQEEADALVDIANDIFIDFYVLPIPTVLENLAQKLTRLASQLGKPPYIVKMHFEDILSIKIDINIRFASIVGLLYLYHFNNEGHLVLKESNENKEN